MVDAREILGQLTQTSLASSADRRLEHAMSPDGMAQPGNPLGDLLGGLLGGGTAGGGAGGGLGGLLGGLGGSGGGLGGGPGGGLSDVLGSVLGGALGGGQGGLGDLAREAGDMLGGAGRSVQSGNPLAMGGLAALAGALLGGGGRSAKGAVGAGLLAVLGSLAFRALQERPAAGAPASAGQGDVPLGVREPQTPAEEQQLQDTASLAIRAMISAAKADGAIDGGEMARIMDKLKDMGADERNFVMQELSRPLDLDGLARDVKGPEQAVQVYGASLLAIDVDTPAERDYLQQLAARLGLDAPTIAAIHEALGVKATVS